MFFICSAIFQHTQHKIIMMKKNRIKERTKENKLLCKFCYCKRILAVAKKCRISVHIFAMLWCCVDLFSYFNFCEIVQFHSFAITKSREENLFAQCPSKGQKQQETHTRFNSELANNAIFFQAFSIRQNNSYCLFRTI